MTTVEASDTMAVDIAALKELNPDIVGWIYIPGTEISYPIVQGGDNDQYLKTAYDGSYSNSGSIFLNARNRSDFIDQNTLIYGHHMRDGSMFGHLMDFEKADFLDTHRRFFIYTQDGTLEYQIFSAFVTYSASFVYTDAFAFSWDYFDFLEDSRNASILDLHVDVTTDDRVVTLSTCTSRGNRAERFVVQGKLITPLDGTDKTGNAAQGETPLTNENAATDTKDADLSFEAVDGTEQ